MYTKFLSKNYPVSKEYSLRKHVSKKEYDAERYQANLAQRQENDRQYYKQNTTEILKKRKQLPTTKPESWSTEALPERK